MLTAKIKLFSVPGLISASALRDVLGLLVGLYLGLMHELAPEHEPRECSAGTCPQRFGCFRGVSMDFGYF